MKVKSSRIFRPGNRFLVPYLAFLSAFAPISTDMYLPALPSMAENLGTSNELVSASISMFMLVFAFSMLAWGSLSDRYGRTPALFAGALIYIISSVGIAFCNSIMPLLSWRCVQAVGSGAATSLSMAIVKDIMKGDRMEKVISLMQATLIIAPLTAPVLGGWMLALVSWRGIFWCLALCGLFAMLGVFCLAETAPKSRTASIAATFARMGVVLGKKEFLKPLLLFSAMSMPFMSYLATSSFIFQDGFGVSAQAYSLFFAFNACSSLMGPLSHLYLLRHLPRNTVICAHLALMSAAGIMLLVLGGKGPWFFALLFAPICYCGSALRPPSTMLMMQSIKGDNGIVASLINCGGLLFGSLSMFIASLAFWPNPILAVGCIAATVSGICLVFWLKIKKDY